MHKPHLTAANERKRDLYSRSIRKDAITGNENRKKLQFKKQKQHHKNKKKGEVEEEETDTLK